MKPSSTVHKDPKRLRRQKAGSFVHLL